MRGFVNLYKPTGMTSNDLVVMTRGVIRKVTGIKEKVGHLGTLDPLASGVLPIAIGKATRLFDYLAFKKKEYIADFVFGVETNTLDREGEICKTSDVIPTVEEIKNILPKFIGKISQVPPIFSAKSVNGRKAYKYARKGQEIELPAKDIDIYDLEIMEEIENGIKLKIVCGGGTYIRALIRDMAKELNTCGYMKELYRSKSGGFTEDNMVTFYEFEDDPLKYILPVDAVLDQFDKVELNDIEVKNFIDGQEVKTNQDVNRDAFFVTNHGEVVSICRLDENNVIRSIKRL